MKYLGVDFGLRRIGLAISDGTLASPLRVIEVKNLDDGIAKIIQIIEAEKIDQIVVGIPGGKTGKLSAKFIKKLQQNGLNVVSADETLSSKNATSEMVKMGIPKKKRSRNDAAAAAIILQNYLDSL